MKIYTLIEIVVVLAIIWLVIAQMAIPALRGTQLFPFFRRERKLRSWAAKQNQMQYEGELEDAIEQQRREWYGTKTKEETDAAQAADEAARAKSWTPNRPMPSAPTPEWAASAIEVVDLDADPASVWDYPDVKRAGPAFAPTQPEPVQAHVIEPTGFKVITHDSKTDQRFDTHAEATEYIRRGPLHNDWHIEPEVDHPQ